MTETPHTHFYRIEAEDHYQFGLLLGKKFGAFARQTILVNTRESDWPTRQERSREFLEYTEKYFPRYVEELRGYAEGANVDFLDLWTLSLEDEVHDNRADKCTTIITNAGKLISHNEDWGKDSEDHVCVLLKKIGALRTFELYYMNTLGGNSISINSHGYVVSVNTLVHGERKKGVPRNVIARLLSETNDPEADFQKISEMPRSLGFSFNILNREGVIWNIEYSSIGAVIKKHSAPFIHTNHYLSELKSNDMNDNAGGSFDRYEVASSRVKPRMTVNELIKITNDNSCGSVLSIMNEKTIAKMVIDIEQSVAKVWLRRESALGWAEFHLDALLGWS